MNKIPTAKEFYDEEFVDRRIDKNHALYLMEEFAKLHVKAALEQVVKLDKGDVNSPGNWILKQEEREKNILNSYPETNIQ